MYSEQEPIKYAGVADEALIERYRAGEQEVEDYLLSKYKRLVRGRARELYLAGGDRDDLLQEGMLGLFKAIREYRPERGSSFAAFAALLIDRQMYSAIEASQRQKHQALNSSVPITEITERQEEAGLGYAASPESIVLGEENARTLREQIDRALSPYERKVLELFLQGLDYTGIAARLSRTPKSVGNALQRIRAKVAAIQGA